MTGKPGGSGPQDMRAKDYRPGVRRGRPHAADRRGSSRTPWCSCRASKGKPRTAGSPARRIDIALAPDGATVTNLTANENVAGRSAGRTATRRRAGSGRGVAAWRRARQEPASRRRPSPAASTSARAAPRRQARRDRSARAKSDRMDIKTKPGFGDLERAELPQQRALHRRRADDGRRADGRLRDRAGSSRAAARAPATPAAARTSRTAASASTRATSRWA